MSGSRSGPKTQTPSDFLDGQMLVAMPSMPDERFARTVIYMLSLIHI